MRKKIAIKGHPTRGKEVIELLEMLGGKNNCDSPADNLGLCYLIDDEFDICAHYFGYDDYEDGELNIFTLEEFLEKYPYKVGDKVFDKVDGDPGIITAMKWDEDVYDMKYHVAFDNGDMGWYTNDTIEFLNLEDRKTMNKKLAIKGHPIRGKEVIYLLKMMGGKNTYGYDGEMKSLYFTISNDTIIYGNEKVFLYDNYVFFTLEEFLEKYPFKVNDKVFLYDNITEGYVTGMKWDEDKGTVKYCVYTSGEYWCDVEELLKWNTIDLDEKHYEKQCDEIQTKIDMDNTMFMLGHTLVPNKMDDKLEYNIINGYEFDKVENGKIILKPIKNRYPNTYKECCDILGIGTMDNDAKDKYIIRRAGDTIVKGYDISCVLEFPTKEMRDAFYDNLRILIENCKELL